MKNGEMIALFRCALAYSSIQRLFGGENLIHSDYTTCPSKLILIKIYLEMLLGRQGFPLDILDGGWGSDAAPLNAGLKFRWMGEGGRPNNW